MTTFPGESQDLAKKLASSPYAEIGYRRGLLDGLDVGAHATLLGTGGVDGKWQFIDDGPLAIATGLGIGYLEIEANSTSGGEASKAKSTLIDAVLPLYVSYDVGSHLAVYSAPKYLLRAVVAESGTKTSHNVGATIGVKLGDAFGLLAESTFMRNLSDSYNMLQFNAAIFWSR